MAGETGRAAITGVWQQTEARRLQHLAHQDEIVLEEINVRLRPVSHPPGQMQAIGRDMIAYGLLTEEIGRGCSSVRSLLTVHDMVAHAIQRWGSPAQKQRYLPAMARGEILGALALSEPEAGSDAKSVQTTAVDAGDAWVLDGRKVFISNAGIADGYVVFARSGEAGPKGISAFFVDDASKLGGTITIEATPIIAPHPLGSVTLAGVRIPGANLLGKEGDGLKIALTTLDLCRATVGGAANGFSRRALSEAIARTKARVQFGKPLSEEPGVQAMLAEMATDLDAARLLVFRAAWTKDHGQDRVTREAAEAKLFATEAAQRIVDSALQLHGGLGVVKGVVVERLYREVRALRIYEGASEIQRLVIGRSVTRGT